MTDDQPGTGPLAGLRVVEFAQVIAGPLAGTLLADLGAQVAKGVLSAPIEKVYPIEDIKTALVHAQRSERTGKILVAPNGPI